MNRRHFSLAFVSGLAAQENDPPAPPPDDTPLFRTGTSLAPVRFHVVRDKRYVSDLKPEDIVLLEDGQPRTITFFEGGVKKRSAPIEVILLFDISGSVTYQGFLDPILYHAALLEGLPTVSMSVYGFARRLHRFSGPTRDQTQLAQAFARLGKGPRPKAIPLSLPPKRKHPDGGSWIYPAVMGAMRDAVATPHDGPLTRLMLVLSDGFETTDARPEDAAGLANELGIPVYPLALGSRLLKERLRTARGELQRAKLETKMADIMEYASLGELTGGRSFEPLQTDAASVRQILRFLAAQVMFEYVAGFVPEPGEGAPKKHKLQVRLANKDAGKIIGGTRTILH